MKQEESKIEILKGLRTNKLQSLGKGTYAGVNEDSKTILVIRKSEGWVIKTETHDGWMESVTYDEDGNQVEITYER